MSEMFLGGERVVRKSFGSSSVAFASYDKITNELTVTFQNGTQYLYRGVSETTVTEFYGAPSAGKFFQAWIRGRYGYDRVR